MVTRRDNFTPNVSRGSITTQNLVPAGAATAGSAIEIDVENASTLTIQISNTYMGALSIQASLTQPDVGNYVWTTLGGADLIINQGTGAKSATIPSAAVGIFQIGCSGFQRVRITGLAAMTGSADIVMKTTEEAAMVGVDTPVTLGGTPAVTVTGTATADTELAAAAAPGDNTANPTVPSVGALASRWNGASWDRIRGNVNTTTLDTGAKTTSFAGVTVTNYDARGAYITLNIGTVTGTSPTLTAQLQWSPDGGTTWINLGPATASITATGLHTLLVYPSNESQAAGATPANLTTGAAQTVAINAPLPRTWRLNYTIGGTTPSFTFTAVNVNYIV